MWVRPVRFIYRGLRRMCLGSGISTLPPLSWIKRRVLCQLRATPRVPVLGSWMRLDPDDRLNLALNGIHEPNDTKLVRRIIRVGDTVVDVGAFIGYYTLYFSRLVGPAGRVFAFEPAPDLAAILRDNVAYNHCANVTVEPLALSDQTGDLLLYMETGRPEVNSILPGKERHRLTRSIQATRLDDYAPLMDRAVDFIKIDVEGAETLALRGMEQLLSRSPNVCVLLELWPYGLLRAGLNPADLFETLGRCGLEVCRVRSGSSLAPVEIDALIEACGVGRGCYINVLAAHPRRMRELAAELSRTV